MTVLSLAMIGWPHDPWRRGAMVDLRKRLDDGSRAIARCTNGLLDLSDWDRLGQWPNERRAWITGARSRGATHVLVLNDDVHPSRGFLESVLRCIEIAPTEMLCFLGNRKAARAKAVEAGSSWTASADGAWGGGLVLPVADVEAMIAYADAHVPAELVWGDHRPVWYALSQRRPIWCSVPSIMQHVGAGHSSLPAGKSLNSVATDFIGFGADAREVDWAAGLPGSDVEAPRERPTGRLYKIARDLAPDARAAAGLDWMVAS